MAVTARTRADVDVRSNLKVDASILDRFPTDCAVEILDSQNGWFLIKPVRLMHAISGWVPGPSLIFNPPESPQVFPKISETNTPSVPPTLKLKDFQAWKIAGGKPDWLAESDWAKLPPARQESFSADITVSIRSNQSRWDNWLAILARNQRLEDAAMDEWIVTVGGGRELYAIRDHYIYTQPVQNESYSGSVIKGQIMRWNGNVHSSGQDAKLRIFYEVEFYRMSRYMRGWFRADILAPYVFPTEKIDPQIEGNASTVFDLSNPVLRQPQDQEIADAKHKGYTGAQYIDVFNATRVRLVHFSLCGEFCAAAIHGVNIIPLLQNWLDSKYPRAEAILKDPHEGTSLTDLQAILKACGMKSEIYSSIPTTPQAIKDRLSAGQWAIAGCGINSIGKIRAEGRIRHWVVIEDVLPVGNDGWVRVYNPFNNQDEVYNYNTFMRSSGVGGGLWVSRDQA